MTVNRNGLFMPPDRGSSYWFGGDLYTIKAAGEDTGEVYALFEALIQPQGGTPPHTHHREDESFFIREGELVFRLDEQTIVATTGTFLYSPKGQLHSFTNISSTPAKLLIWVTPAGFEKFLAEVGVARENQVTPAPPLNPADLDRIVTVAKNYGIEILPP
jgi:quercetin dioxygenase-like cupin family protein